MLTKLEVVVEVELMCGYLVAPATKVGVFRPDENIEDEYCEVDELGVKGGGDDAEAT